MALSVSPPPTHTLFPQAGDIRTAIGSGLLQLGVTPKAMVGLYSVNCKGAHRCKNKTVCWQRSATAAGCTTQGWQQPRLH